MPVHCLSSERQLLCLETGLNEGCNVTKLLVAAVKENTQSVDWIFPDSFAKWELKYKLRMKASQSHHHLQMFFREWEHSDACTPLLLMALLKKHRCIVPCIRNNTL